jgi:hypothetical protein
MALNNNHSLTQNECELIPSLEICVSLNIEKYNTTSTLDPLDS